jgi:hypothetical protein
MTPRRRGSRRIGRSTAPDTKFSARSALPSLTLLTRRAAAVPVPLLGSVR